MTITKEAALQMLDSLADESNRFTIRTLRSFIEQSEAGDRDADARDAARYRWLKLESPPGAPYDLHAKMLEAKRFMDAYAIFCTSWTGWDAAIDAAIQSSKVGESQ